MLLESVSKENTIVPGISDKEPMNDFSDTVAFVLDIANRYSAPDEHMVIATYWAALVAAQERLPDGVQMRMAEVLFNLVDSAKIEEEGPGISLSFAPAYIEDLMEEILHYLRGAGLTQKAGVLTLIALVRLYFDRVTVTQQDKQKLQEAIFQNLVTKN